MTSQDKNAPGTGGSIVVGVDGSDASVAALRWAVTEAAVTGQEVRAVTAWTYLSPLDPGSDDAHRAQMESRHDAQLNDLVRKVAQGHPGVAVRCVIVEDDPAGALLDASRGADLLVLGSHGTGKLLRAFVGSVSTRCLNKASCPVVIIPAHATDRLKTGQVPADSGHAARPL